MRRQPRIKEFFDTYVFAWMCEDIAREIAWAKERKSAGNWLPSSFLPRPVDCGIGVAGNGSYYFVVEKYFIDFKAACERWRDMLVSSPPTVATIPDVPPMSDSDGGPYW